MTPTEQLPPNISSEQTKRGRGRPRIENPLSPAERAKRYRERKRWQRVSQTGQARAAGSEKEGKAAHARTNELTRQLEAANVRMADLTGALHEVVLVASAGKRIPPHLLKGLVKLLAE